MELTMTDLNVDKLTPPPELVQQWEAEGQHRPCKIPLAMHIATQAARWGADQELEACAEWVQGYAECGDSLRAARRPKPPSLKEQALRLVFDYGAPFYKYTAEQTDIIRRALEALPND
jgi:hypothetical protein